MMLVLGPLLLLTYLAAVYLTGAEMLRVCLGTRDASGLHAPTSLMLGLCLSFLIFVLMGLLFPMVAIYASMAVPFAAGLALALLRPKTLQALRPKFTRSWVLTVAIIWTLLLTQYGIECSTLLTSVARGDGVIYQDIIYHGGIARSLALNGFPAQNLQYSGEHIGYHIFSHFIAAQLSTLLSASVQVTYSFVVTPLFFLLIAASAASFISVVSESEKPHFGFKALIIYASLYSVFLLSGTPDPATPLYLSHSYQLQIASLLIIFSYLYLLANGTVHATGKVVFMLSALFAQAALIKGSSMPLVMAAFGAWVTSDAISRKRLRGWHVLILGSLAASAALVYFVFYYYPGYAVAPSDFTIFTHRLYEMDIVRKAVETMGNRPVIVWMAAFVSIVSFRFILALVPFKAYTGAILAAFASGVAMYICIRYAANYYLLAVVCVANMYALTQLALHWNRIAWVFRIAIVGAVLLSIYPLSSGGRPTAHITLSRKADTYFPLTPEKRRLYERLRSVSNRESLIFTSSIEGAPSGVPDNYYPAALSGRQFYLGGYRLRIQELPGLQERLDLVKSFTAVSPAHRRRLDDLGIDFVLIETADLAESERQSTLADIESSPFYRIVYQNSAGVILAPNVASP
jgi:hypothetical protein